MLSLQCISDGNMLAQFRLDDFGIASCRLDSCLHSWCCMVPLDRLTAILAAPGGNSEVCSGRQRANNHAASMANGGELGIAQTSVRRTREQFATYGTLPECTSYNHNRVAV